MKLLRRIRYLLGRRQAEADLTEELEQHRAIASDQAAGDWDRAYAESRAVWRWPLPKWHRRAISNSVRNLLRAGKKAARWMGVRLIEGLSVIVFVLLQLYWEPITGTSLTWRTRVTLCVFYALVAIAEGIKHVEQGLRRETSAKPKRVFVEDPDAVLELAKLTGYESIKPFNRYLGKWMSIAGEFEGFGETLQGDAFHMSLRLDDGRRLNLSFDRSQRDSLQPLRPGQHITAIGEIERVSFELRPQHCELVRVEPLRAAPRLNYSLWSGHAAPYQSPETP